MNEPIVRRSSLSLITGPSGQQYRVCEFQTGRVEIARLTDPKGSVLIDRQDVDLVLTEAGMVAFRAGEAAEGE